MTEDEAKTKWCPFVRYLATFRSDEGKLETAGCFNRGGADSGLEKSLCIGSKCMAWRWDNKKWGHDPSLHGAEAAEKFTRENPLTGHCGAFS